MKLTPTSIKVLVLPDGAPDGKILGCVMMPRQRIVSRSTS
jgi:hypothetical protein